MADKRTTPDPAEGAGRRKRPAPTIDLTATEVPEAAAAAQPQAATDEASNAVPESSAPHAGVDDALNAEAGLRKGSIVRASWQIFIAGLTGAAVMTAVLLGLWFAGLVPSRDAGPAIADPATAAALDRRLAKIESSIARLPASDRGTSERLSAADNALKSLGIALTAINKRSDEVAASAAEARAHADASEKALTELRNSVQDLSKNSSAGLSPAEVDTVQKRLVTLEQMVKAVPADKVARLALSAIALREAVASGAPYSAELSEAKSLGADEKTLAPLARFAASGLPSPAMLAQELRTLVPAMKKAAGPQTPASGFLERLEANAGKLVRIRPVDAPAGDDAAAVLARVENEAAHAAIDDALVDLGKLDAVARAPAQDWIAKAQARQNALAAAHLLASKSAHALGRQ